MAARTTLRFQPTNLTGAICVGARRELGLSQAALVKGAAVPSWVVKQSEANAMRIDVPNAKKLIAFFEAQGVDLYEVAGYAGQTTSAAEDSAEPTKERGPGFTREPRPGFFISESIARPLYERLMDQMEANDDRIGELMAEAFTPGFFGGLSGDTESKVQEVLLKLAENYLLFRCLQGRNVVKPMRGEPENVGDYLATLMQGQPEAELLGVQRASSTEAA